jgi:hypothetical protein
VAPSELAETARGVGAHVLRQMRSMSECIESQSLLPLHTTYDARRVGRPDSASVKRTLLRLLAPIACLLQLVAPLCRASRLRTCARGVCSQNNYYLNSGTERAATAGASAWRPQEGEAAHGVARGLHQRCHQRAASSCAPQLGSG